MVNNFILKFSVYRSNIRLENPIRHLSRLADTFDVFKCHFKFDKSWDGFEKRIFFKNISYNITKAVIPDAEGYCFIPWEVLAHTGVIVCSISGVLYNDSVMAQRINAGPVQVFVQRDEVAISPYDETPLTPTDYEQFVAQYSSDIDNMQADWLETDESSLAYIKNKPEIDNYLSDSSNNAVSNKTITEALNDKLDISSGAEENQNSFSYINVGSDQVQAGSKTDAFTLIAGDNISFDVDTEDNEITINAVDIDTDTTYEPVSSTENGLMTAADKNKLDSIDVSLIGQGGADTLDIYEITNDHITLDLIDSSDAYVEDSTPYLYRAVGDVGGDRLRQMLVGGTVCWNQLVGNGAFYSGTQSGITITADSTTKTITVAGTATADMQFNFYTFRNAFVKDHVYYLPQPRGASANTHFIRTGESTFWGYKNIGKMVADSATDSLRVRVLNGQTVNYTFRPQFHDLTAFFGNATIADHIYSLEQANAGAGVAFLKNMGFFTKPYYEYDAGTLKSVTPTAHVTRGVNAWDEEWEVGGISVNGADTANTDRIRSKNYIPVIPNTIYCIHADAGGGRICYYDGDKTFISVNDGISLALNPTFTTPSDCQYIRFCTFANYGTTYNHDICINISDPTINGQYFPYEEHTYDLGNVPLYGLFQLENGKLKAYGDVRHAVGGTDRKFGLVDLGTLNYTYNSGDTYFYATISDLKDNGGWGKVSNVICDKYVTTFPNNISSADKAVCVWNSGNRLIIRDTAYTNVTTFKQAMSGVYLVYEKTTPTTETADPYEEIQICNPHGTEGFTTDNDMPVGHETIYTRVLDSVDLPLVNNTYAGLMPPTLYTTLNGLVDQFYYKVGDSIVYGGQGKPDFDVDGYVSENGTQVYFTIPLNKPCNAAEVEVTSANFRVRQNGNYVYGSTASGYLDMTSETIASLGGYDNYGMASYIRLTVTFNSDSRVINNDVISLKFAGTLTFTNTSR